MNWPDYLEPDCDCLEDFHCDRHQQDGEEGAALRKLREALPSGRIVMTIDRPVLGESITIEIDNVAEGHVVLAATIAEAADECREALEVTDD